MEISSHSLYTPVPTRAAFAKAARMDRLARGEVYLSKYVLSVEHGYETWRTTGDDQPLYKALKAHIRRLVYHVRLDTQLGQWEKDDVSGVMWLAAAEAIAEHTETDELFLLEKIYARVKARTVDEIRKMNAQKRKPPGQLVKLPESIASQEDTPEEAYLRKEFLDVVYGAMSDEQQLAARMRSSGMTLDAIAATLWPDEKPHPQRVKRVLERAGANATAAIERYED